MILDHHSNHSTESNSGYDSEPSFNQIIESKGSRTITQRNRVEDQGIQQWLEETTQEPST
ncbi:hypothetical protein C1H46_042793 [Malus baccata]|uniref:Uncharacterized protein n=1 Tax=Malus baccata TaxID=106549 RepID=A0A540KBS1_MALBA|nr:hypothetical protein C1H46_042793 [Malus baccata]